MGRPPIQTHITFLDHSLTQPEGEDEDPRSRKRPRDLFGIDIPNVELLRIHAALTRVLHLSGAAGILPEPASPDVPDDAYGGVANYGADFVDKVVYDTIAGAPYFPVVAGRINPAA